MKKDIHPKTYMATIRCNCGYESQALSTLGELVQVDVCSNCHPFYTGRQKLVDTGGRVDKFKKRMEQK